MVETFIHSVKFDERGLIPAIVQDAATKEVVALYYLDNGRLAETLQTGRATFATGGASGHAEIRSYPLLDVRAASGGELLTVFIEREEVAPVEEQPISLLRDLAGLKTTTQEVSLFDVGSMEFGLAINELYALIEERQEKRPEGSYTTYLFNSGLDKILKKIAEESGEVIIAAKNASPREIVSELADLFYHLLVLMVERDVKLSDVHGELARRAANAPQTDQG